MLKHNTFHNFLHNNNWGDELSSVFTWDTVLLPNTKNLLSLWNNYKRGFACRLYSLKKKKEKGFGSSQTGYWGYLPDRLRRPSSSKHLEPFWASTSMETSNTWWCWLFFVAAFSPIFEYSTKKKKKKPNKEDVYMLVKKNKKQTKVGNGFLFLMSKIQMESQIWTRKSSKLVKNMSHLHSKPNPKTYIEWVRIFFVCIS